MLDRSIPTPGISEVVIGPLHFHFYALCIIAGIAVAIYVGNRRFLAAGGGANVIADVAIIAVPSGIIGGRIYHVISSPDNYFGNSGNFWDAFKIWEGGLGIWGAISLGAFGAWIAHLHQPYYLRKQLVALGIGLMPNSLAVLPHFLGG